MAKTLKFEVGQKVDYILADRVHFSGTIIKAAITRKFKPYTIEAEDGNIYFSHEAQLCLSGKIEYKGFRLVTKPDGIGFRTIAYMKGSPVYVSYSEHPSDLDSETKCKMKIDGTRESMAGPYKFK